MAYVISLFVVLLIAASAFAREWLANRRRAGSPLIDEAEPMSWHNRRDALILIAAGVGLVVGAFGVLAARLMV